MKEGQNPIYGWLKKCPFGQVIFVMLTKEKKTRQTTDSQLAGEYNIRGRGHMRIDWVRGTSKNLTNLDCLIHLGIRFHLTIQPQILFIIFN